MLELATQGILVMHVAAGAVALLAGTVAVCVRKGGRWHRAAGKWFTTSMLLMASSACWLGAVLPRQSVNVLIGALAIYLITTAWRAVLPRARYARVGDWASLAVSLCLCAPFAMMIGQLLGGPQVIDSAIPLRGPVLVALIAFSAMLAAAAVGDARVVAAGGLTGTARIARHLWRMCLGLTFAAGSGFTNGLARLLPGPYHVPTVFFLPQFIPLIVMAYWLWRVRRPGGFVASRLGM